MSETTLRRIAWALLALAGACVAAAIAFALVTGQSGQGRFLPMLATATFSVVGALVAAGRPRNRIGWLLLAIGVSSALGLVTSALYEWDRHHPGTVTGAAVYAWLDGFLWLLWIGFLIPRVLLLFPDGRLPSPRWRVVSRAQFVLLAALVVAGLKPGPIHDYEKYDNPFGVGALSWLYDLFAHLAFLAFLAVPLLLFATLAPVVSLVVRLRRSRGVERLQMKWVTWTVGVTAMLWIGAPVLQALTGFQILSTISLVAMCLSPISIGIAVLRYRLYEIDRVISRTLVYGSLTVLLGSAYVGLVLAGQALFSSFAGGSNLAIAASTLVVAALFLPVRARVQRFVDRRFYRRRYDAQRTLDVFGTRLREQIELEALRGDLVAVVGETMQPAHVSVWLREALR